VSQGRLTAGGTASIPPRGALPRGGVVLPNWEIASFRNRDSVRDQGTDQGRDRDIPVSGVSGEGLRRRYLRRREPRSHGILLHSRVFEEAVAGRTLRPVRHQLDAYFALTEAVSLLQHQIEQQLRTEGGISYVQFQLLARLNARGPLTMTDLADGVVYSRSGLTYQAGLLEKAGLVTRAPGSDDERATLVTITDSGRALLGQVIPGHNQVTRLLLDPCPTRSWTTSATS
jgi:DNA-binding MarR family transcriptional regulator